MCTFFKAFVPFKRVLYLFLGFCVFYRDVYLFQGVCSFVKNTRISYLEIGLQAKYDTPPSFEKMFNRTNDGRSLQRRTDVLLPMYKDSNPVALYLSLSLIAHTPSPRHKAFPWEKCALSAVDPMRRSDALGARISDVSLEMKFLTIGRHWLFC